MGFWTLIFGYYGGGGAATPAVYPSDGWAFPQQQTVFSFPADNIVFTFSQDQTVFTFE